MAGQSAAGDPFVDQDRRRLCVWQRGSQTVHASAGDPGPRPQSGTGGACRSAVTASIISRCERGCTRIPSRLASPARFATSSTSARFTSPISTPSPVGRQAVLFIGPLPSLGLGLWVDAGVRDRTALAPLLAAGVSSLVVGLETVRGPRRAGRDRRGSVAAAARLQPRPSRGAPVDWRRPGGMGHGRCIHAGPLGRRAWDPPRVAPGPGPGRDRPGNGDDDTSDASSPGRSRPGDHRRRGRRQSRRADRRWRRPAQTRS